MGSWTESPWRRHPASGSSRADLHLPQCGCLPVRRRPAEGGTRSLHSRSHRQVPVCSHSAPHRYGHCLANPYQPQEKWTPLQPPPQPGKMTSWPPSLTPPIVPCHQGREWGRGGGHLPETSGHSLLGTEKQSHMLSQLLTPSQVKPMAFGRLSAST